MTMTGIERELWILGLGKQQERGEIVRSYLAEAGYKTRIAELAELENGRPLGVVLDISPFSADGWGILLAMKNNPASRDIPVLPVFLSDEGRVGEVFPVAGFFTLPIDVDYLHERLAVLGLTEEAEDYDLQTLIVSRRGEEQVAKAIEAFGFEVVNAYTGKEGMALATTGHQYLVFCSLMLSDMGAFELLERLRLYPQTRNIPFFVLIKDNMKDGERRAMSREIAHLVRKKYLGKEEFLSHLRRRG